MTACRTVPVRQADTTKGSKENDNGAISQPVTAAVAPEQPSAARSSRGFAAAIKGLFREVKQVLTASIHRAPEPKKRTRRGRREARSGFRLAACILSRVVRSIFHPGSLPPPCDPDDALHQLHWNNQAGLHETGGFHSGASPPSNDLSPSP